MSEDASVHGESIAAFGAHLAKMRAARGWSLRQMSEMNGINASTVMRAERGNDLMLSKALLIAGTLGVPLGGMLVSPQCEQCQDVPPPGFTCRKCGTDG